MVAQERAESGFNWARVGDNGQAVGAFQWHPDRQAKILQATGINVADPHTTHLQQLQAMFAEGSMGLDRQTAEAFKQMQRATDARISGALGAILIERPKDTFGQARARGALSSDIYNRYAVPRDGQTPRQPAQIAAPDWLKQLAPTGNDNNPWAAQGALDRLGLTVNGAALDALSKPTIIMPSLPPQSAGVAKGGGDKHAVLNQNTTINVTGSSDPHMTAALIQRDQSRLYPDLLRNLQGAVQ
jgi:hypothetical protein